MRIIPAYAGSTSSLLPGFFAEGDHPRIRGEHLDSENLTTITPGSSPHTRGAQTPRNARPSRSGIIPAYAGSTQATLRWRHSRPDHPRIRGEHQPSDNRRRTLAGSSPHTRGARRHRHPRRGRRGIIPAYAGSTRGSARRAHRTGDHPRIRGEHGDAIDGVGDEDGSSPHTRGARFSRDTDTPAIGIIPAYAGSTGRRPRRGRSGRDHPRIRGEHRRAGQPGALDRGSSPHTRGAHAALDVEGLAARIIPAYAGSTFRQRILVGTGQDHPRIRGEHEPDAVRLVGSSGSSPHTRGAPADRLGGHQDGRIIPAYAGSTRGVDGGPGVV